MRSTDHTEQGAHRLLEVENLTVTTTPARGEAIRLVDGVSLSVDRGEIVGVVGESGCGKSLTMLGILGLLPPGVEGSPMSRVSVDGTDLARADRSALDRIRGNILALIPSDAGAALSPVERVGVQLDRAYRTHEKNLPARQRRTRILDLFRRVRLPQPELQYQKYPHELSGGMQQRVAIAAALLNDPQLVIADEPTTALDMTVQAQVLRLLLQIRDRSNAGILFVTHDITAVAEICNRVIVMYAGQVVEVGPVERVVAKPRHPYTKALVASIPPLEGERPEQLVTIAGAPPSPGAWPDGCRFRDRCSLWQLLGQPERCTTERPSLAEHDDVACHFAEVAA